MSILNKIFKKNEKLAKVKFIKDYSPVIRVKMKFDEELHPNPYNKEDVIYKKLNCETSYGKLIWILMDNVNKGIEPGMSKELLDFISIKTQVPMEFFIHNHVEEINTGTLKDLPVWDFNELGIITEDNALFFKQVIHMLSHVESVYSMNDTTINS